VYCTLTKEQATLYEAVAQDMMMQIEEAEAQSMKRRGLELSMWMQLKQICNHPVQYLHRAVKMVARLYIRKWMKQFIKHINPASMSTAYSQASVIF